MPDPRIEMFREFCSRLSQETRSDIRDLVADLGLALTGIEVQQTAPTAA